MVGDGLGDVQAGNAAGCRTVLVTHFKIEQIERFLCVNCGYSLPHGVGHESRRGALVRISLVFTVIACGTKIDLIR